MAVRTGNWGWRATMLSWHSPATVELAPPDAPGVLVRVTDGLPQVPRDLTVQTVVELAVCDAAGAPVLLLRPADGTVERHDDRDPGAVWELRIEATDNRAGHLYARAGTPFPDPATLDALAQAATTVRPR